MIVMIAMIAIIRMLSTILDETAVLYLKNAIRRVLEPPNSMVWPRGVIRTPNGAKGPPKVIQNEPSALQR